MRSQKRRVRRKRRKPVILFLAFGLMGAAVAGGVLWGIRYLEEKNARKTPEELLLLYMEHISRQEYEEMYEMLDPAVSSTGSLEEFVNRNSAIYKGIEMQNMQVEVKSYDQEELAVTYQTSFDTAAGKMSFENKAFFVDGEDSYKIAWNDSLIFPELGASDKVRVSVLEAKRGEILDRNGHVLAGWGTASSAGIVPGRLEDWNGAVAEAARLLDIEVEVIEKKRDWTNRHGGII